MKYIKQLDALRAIAVILVIISHWVSQSILPSKGQLGILGVGIFFVLSGFLITSILLNSRYNLNNALRSFYIRRALRIFPIYFLFILCLFIIKNIIHNDSEPNYIYFLTYTSNFFYFSQGKIYGFLAHTWSLCVEEQFYLFWPIVILFTPLRLLKYIISAFIIGGIVSVKWMDGRVLSNVVLLTSLHYLCSGALLSFAYNYKRSQLYKIMSLWLILGFISLSYFAYTMAVDHSSYYDINLEIVIIPIVFIIYATKLEGNKSYILKPILENNTLVRIGKISYGLYLYHYPIPYFIDFINSKITPHYSFMFYQKYNQTLFWFECVGVLILISCFSYKWIETPFLKLKDRVSAT